MPGGRWLPAGEAARDALERDPGAVLSYTETATGTGLVPLGYPVPLPIDSQTPVDGFRSHAALVARLQALALGSASFTPIEMARGRTPSDA